MNRIIAFIVRRPRAVISMVIALSAFFAFGLWRGVQLDVSPLGFVEREGQARSDFETARKNFGPDDYLVVAVVCDDVFAPAGVTRLRDLHDRISKTRGVAEVLSLANAPYARSVGGVVSAESLLDCGFRISDCGFIDSGNHAFTASPLAKDRAQIANPQSQSPNPQSNRIGSIGPTSNRFGPHCLGSRMPPGFATRLTHSFSLGWRKWV